MFLFIHPLLTVFSEVTGLPTLLAYWSSIPVVLSWLQPHSHRGSSYFCQPCWWSCCCFCHLYLKGLVEGVVEWPVTADEEGLLQFSVSHFVDEWMCGLPLDEVHR
jgi:hypothetical protein